MQERRLLASWVVTRACNFSCSYCCSKRDKRYSTIPVQDLRKTLKETGNEWTISLTGGGEPFLYPDFIELCKELIKDFQIRVQTNLSLDAKVLEFANSIEPNKVKFILVSTHIEELEKRNILENFIRNILLLKEKGFNLKVRYVLHPLLIGRFNKDYDYFYSRGIKLFMKPFKGRYKNKLYPMAYTDDIKEWILKNDPLATFYPFCFKGIKCNAGRTFIRINTDGRVTRCTKDSAVLGDTYNGIKLNKTAEPCRVYECPCYGYDLIENRSFRRDKSNFNLLHKILSVAEFDQEEQPYALRLFDSIKRELLGL